MTEPFHDRSAGAVMPFDPGSFTREQSFTQIGSGSIGAKARGLAGVQSLLAGRVAPAYTPIVNVDIPLLTVIATDYFDLFLQRNGLPHEDDAKLSDIQTVSSFQRGELPQELVRALRAFVTEVNTPLAVRSSSLLEDAMHEPFAGVYATRMIPNNSPDVERRLADLSRAVKSIYASTFLKQARDYLNAAGRTSSEEKMAVIIQEAVGMLHQKRFYPHVAGVARSFNFYPVGLARPEDGVIELALGLGKAIVEEGISWSVSPAYPHANPPYNTLSDLLKQTQKHFWAIDMSGSAQQLDDVDYLSKFTLADAERDGALNFIASTFRAEDEKIVWGTSGAGPRVLDFAQILKADLIPLTNLLQDLLRGCETALGTMVNIEFALTFSSPQAAPVRFGFLQVRPMEVSHSQVEVSAEELAWDNAIVASDSALGNGALSTLEDVVYIKPRALNAAGAYAVGLELEEVNRTLAASGRPYVLIGFGRWGSSDPSAGIPVNFGQISAAKVIVEATSPQVGFIPSQGSHFFHNVTSFKILYFSISPVGRSRVDWDWLAKQPAVTETEFVRHIRLATPLLVKVDGRTGRGGIFT